MPSSTGRTPKILFVNPRFPRSLWGFQGIADLVGVRCGQAPSLARSRWSMPLEGCMARYPRPVTVVRQFVERINAHDVEGIVRLLAPDHRFIDSLGTVFEGEEALRAGWSGYLRMVPDYVIDIERLIDDGDAVFLIGQAGGTYTHDGTLRAENAWLVAAEYNPRANDEDREELAREEAFHALTGRGPARAH